MILTRANAIGRFAVNTTADAQDLADRYYSLYIGDFD